ncbi:MAG: transcriptional regulator [Rhodobacteraceae bacterium]|nr:MAG: transcriptional regulator [Paracoccaceae bacterium]
MVENSNPRLDALFASLSDQTRRAILLMLLESDLTVKDIAAPFDMSLAAVSKHIQILAKAGLLTQHKSGREKWCRLDPNALKPAAFWLESYGQFLDDSFDLLEELIELQGISTGASTGD